MAFGKKLRNVGKAAKRVSVNTAKATLVPTKGAIAGVKATIKTGSPAAGIKAGASNIGRNTSSLVSSNLKAVLGKNVGGALGNVASGVINSAAQTAGQMAASKLGDVSPAGFDTPLSGLSANSKISSDMVGASVSAAGLSPYLDLARQGKDIVDDEIDEIHEIEETARHAAAGASEGFVSQLLKMLFGG